MVSRSARIRFLPGLAFHFKPGYIGSGSSVALRYILCPPAGLPVGVPASIRGLRGGVEYLGR
jgi:hypothetical protein